jgi:hypothetical protein
MKAVAKYLFQNMNGKMRTKNLRIIFRLKILIFCITHVWTAGCPIEDDPTNLARCVNVDLTGIVASIRSTDLTNVCAIADRYMECFKTYTRGCVGQHVYDRIQTIKTDRILF